MEPSTRRRAVIKRDHVQVDEPAACAPRPRPETEKHVAPAGGARVRLLRLDETTQALELTCSCGEVSLVEIKTAEIRTEKKP